MRSYACLQHEMTSGGKRGGMKSRDGRGILYLSKNNLATASLAGRGRALARQYGVIAEDPEKTGWRRAASDRTLARRVKVAPLRALPDLRVLGGDVSLGASRTEAFWTGVLNDILKFRCPHGVPALG